MLGNTYFETYFEYSFDYSKSNSGNVGLFYSKVCNFHSLTGEGCFSYRDNTHSSVMSMPRRPATGSSFSITRALKSHMERARRNFTPDICEWGAGAEDPSLQWK